MKFPTLSNFDVKGKKILLRLDLNSPVLDGKVIEGPRLIEGAETIKSLSRKGAMVAIIAHQGRKGDSDFISLEQHAAILSRLSSVTVKYIDSLFEQKASEAINNLKPGEAILLKNVRSYGDETDAYNPRNNYYSLCKQFDLYVNDAFSVCHREQGSVIIPPKAISSCIGQHLEREIEALEKFSTKKHARNIFLLGGAKVEDYFPLFKVLENPNNTMLISGVMANLFLISDGGNLGYENQWLEENDYTKFLPKIKEIYSKYTSQIILPVDFAIGGIEGKDKRKEISVLDFPVNEKIWDIGSETIEEFKSALHGAKTIFMKGPTGFSQTPQYSNGTLEILKEISKLSRKGTFTLLGGGHLTTTLNKYAVKNNFSYISTSGGALIAYVSGEKLPGIEAIKNSIH